MRSCVRKSLGLAVSWCRAGCEQGGPAPLRKAFLDASISLPAPGPRAFSTKVPLELVQLPGQRSAGLFTDWAKVAQMLPNRSLYAPQFSPHGISLVPRILLMSKRTSSQDSSTAPQALKAQSESAAPTLEASTLKDSSQNDTELLCKADKTMVWRKSKMKKLKIKKRRQAARYKNS
mmetsp:Transcript_4556/g.7782  ORF Transcript_4556/g.7782 Transcript_4556/m.7782 type:complete len:176 (+) Transcript_4556:175-702(+)|eukprot:CAMPEP_0119106536 /NCGR_PEP_ID=MMETSP1180-20130426/4544_1 /TAXON_ID=3052 ORGANISM="Chlamydomonas cf sp, Strain CCMP681" /NCGR_SAMPLE_ID=MMETSP1180 /ASSEMBLY_ACC=CAM_ASM_000741 /LENGTH=175 /DNA_ID=CAMNT_0007091893 /DNA_START=143 /DNA_END=670 /DNA_ORIENTATION=-